MFLSFKAFQFKIVKRNIFRITLVGICIFIFSFYSSLFFNNKVQMVVVFSKSLHTLRC